MRWHYDAIVPVVILISASLTALMLWALASVIGAWGSLVAVAVILGAYVAIYFLLLRVALYWLDKQEAR